MPLPRTQEALATFDAQVNAAWDALFAMSNEDLTDGHVYRVVALEHRLGEAVGEAFGHDTADFNSMDTCRGCVRPGSWLRAVVEGEISA